MADLTAEISAASRSIASGSGFRTTAHVVCVPESMVSSLAVLTVLLLPPQASSEAAETLLLFLSLKLVVLVTPFSPPQSSVEAAGALSSLSLNLVPSSPAQSSVGAAEALSSLASIAGEIGYYHLLTYLHKNAHHRVLASDLDRYGARNISTERLYLDTAHTLDDLMVRCSWRGERCGPGNFTRVMTDHGVCYTFDSQGLSVQTAGVEDGLSLTLNVEQYEYMPGPHDASGVKILLHDRNEFPKVHALGQALSTGVHSFLAVKLLSVKNLPPPHGECDSPELKHFAHYGTSNCETDCSSRLLRKICGCRLHYMPGDAGNVPVCTLGDVYECYLPNKNLLRKLSVDCHCPVPCHFFAFDPVVSYAMASPLVVERFLADVNKSALAGRFDRAREVTHRLEPEKRQDFENRVDDVETKLGRLQGTMSDDLSVRLTRQKAGLAEIDLEVMKLWSTTSYLFQYQTYIVEKDFVRAATAMRERTFDVVASAMQEVVNKIESKLNRLADPVYNDSGVRSALYLLTLTEIDARIDIANRALDNYTQLYNSIINGTPVFNYRFRSEPRKNSKYIVPLPLFRKALKRTRTIRIRTKMVAVDLADIISNLTLYRNIAEEAYSRGVVNRTAMHHANVFFLKACREYRQSVDMFINDGLGYTLTALEDRHDRFSRLLRDYVAERDSLIQQLDNVMSHVIGLEDGLFIKVSRGINMSRMFLEDGSFTKKDIAKHFLSEEVRTGQSEFRNFFAELRSRGQAVFDAWDRLETCSERIQNMSRTDTNLQNYYAFKNLSLFWDDLRTVLNFMHSKFQQYRTSLDIRDVVKHYDAEFLTSLGGVVSDLKSFVDSGHIDASFIRNNFLRLDIFYRELNYEQITQQKAYDIFALLCDIGGSMGLFLGASVLTIFELLDLFIFQYGRKKKNDS